MKINHERKQAMVSIRAEFQEVMNMLRRLKGSIALGDDPDELDAEGCIQ